MSKKWLLSLGSIGLVLIVLVAAAVAFVRPGTFAHASGSPNLPVVKNINPNFTVLDTGAQIPQGTVGAAVTPNSGGGTLPTWSSAFPYGGKNYKYTMVGTDPSAGSATTTIPVEIIPVDISFSTGIAFDGTKKAHLTASSPLFHNANFISGNTQYGDAIQRQEFGTYIATVSQQYHVLLSKPTILPTIYVSVPAKKGLAALTTTNVEIGLVDYNWWGSEITQWIQQIGVQPNVFPIFLTYNTLLYIGNPGNCCVIGFHGALHNKQTFAWASWTDPGIFTVPINDVNALSHETAEWLNDPYTNNVVPAWSVPSEPQYGCSKLLEVGDPLVGVTFTMDGYTLQDEASFSWFARLATSLNKNHEYSYLGTFTTYSPSCG